MQLRLTYSGLLLGTGNRSRADHVHAIRKRFHPQLKHFWSVNPWLQKYLPGPKRSYENELFQKIGADFSKFGYRFIPLVRRQESLTCAVDILFLRPGHRGEILSKGDIDNRLSTLFDALSVPAHSEQLAKHPTPADGEDPFYCLLEDDALVTQVSVDTDEILEVTDAGLDRNAARVVVTVRLSPSVNLGYPRTFADVLSA